MFQKKTKPSPRAITVQQALIHRARNAPQAAARPEHEVQVMLRMHALAVQAQRRDQNPDWNSSSSGAHSCSAKKVAERVSFTSWSLWSSRAFWWRRHFPPTSLTILSS